MSDIKKIVSNVSDAECIKMIKFTTSELSSKPVESAVRRTVEYMRRLFGLSCVSVREIIQRPCSLRYTYESMDSTKRIKRINETVTFDKDVWDNSLDMFRRGCYLYNAGNGKSYPKFLGISKNGAKSILELPMYSSGSFLGTIDFVDFEHTRSWQESEIDALTICSNIICQYLCRQNLTFVAESKRDEFDPLTGLLDYHILTERLDRRIAEMLGISPVAVVYTDIHHFKYINEFYGYKKGDEILRIAAEFLAEGGKSNPNFMLSRVHSDNFVSVAPISSERLGYFDSYIKEKNSELAAKFRGICPDVRMRLNTGIYYINDPNISAETAIANANLARKIAKTDNLRRPLVFTTDMMDDIKNQEFLNNELPDAIKNHDLKVYYQPKISCADESLYGAEALIRWQRPDGTFIYPDQFIPLFEKNGNIIDVDFYVYKEVFIYLRRRLDAGLPVVPISMNVSRVHFKSDNIVPYIKSLLKEYEIPPELVEFELTENIYLKNLSSANDFIKTCRDMNIQISMDDFGSGFSSLNVLSSLTIDTLKIDKVFLKNPQLADSDKTVLESMIGMAKRLGMNVLCEGVETQSQSEFLKAVHCDLIQGYYYGRPMDESSFSLFMDSWKINAKNKEQVVQ